MGNNSSKKERGLYSRPPSKRWKKNSKPRDYWKTISDLDTEFKIPSHLHYRSCDSVDEDLFTTDSRDPCLIHLHSKTRSDYNDVFRGSQAYAKPPRPKSFDPNILLDEKSDEDFVLSSKSIANIVSTVETEVDDAKLMLPTPEKRMQIESAQHKAEIISVDTSGSQFDRRVNFRRSQRNSVANTKKKNQQKLKERHKTLTALPDHVSSEFGLYGIHRPSSLHSDLNSNSSFTGDGSVISGDSSVSPRGNRPDLLPSSPVRRRLKNRYSMPVTKSMPGSPQRGARVSLHQPETNTLSTFPRNSHNEKLESVVTNGRSSSSEAESSQHQIFVSDKNAMGEDRISSGFWSGSESCRHSTTSEILQQHQNVTQALQQVLSNKPHPIHDENRFKPMDNETNASTISINSRLSVLDRASTLSSSMSLSHTPPGDRILTPEDSYQIPRSDETTPRQLNFATPAGAYNFMNSNFEEKPPQLPHLSSPMDLLILGSRRGNDGLIRDELESFDSSSHSQNASNVQRYHKDSFRDTQSEVHPTPTSFAVNSFSNSSAVFSSSDVVIPKTASYQQHPHSVFTPNTPRHENQHVNSVSNLQDKGSNNNLTPQSYHPVFIPSTPQSSNVQGATPARPNQSVAEVSNQPTQSRFFGPNFTAVDASSSPAQPVDFQAELKSRLERGSRGKESITKPSLPRRQSSLRSRHKEVKEILAYMEPLSNVEKSQSTASSEISPNTSPNTKKEGDQSFASQASVSLSLSESPESSPQSLSSASYQPSKSVAAQLQTRRPTTMYDFPLSPHSLRESPRRPVSVVEPLPKPLTPKTPVETSILPQPQKSGKKPVPLPAVPPKEISAFQASHTPTAILKPLTPNTPLSPKFPDPPSASDLSAASVSPLKSTAFAAKPLENTFESQQTPLKSNQNDPENVIMPRAIAFSPAQLQAAGKSLRRTTSNDTAQSDPQTPQKVSLKNSPTRNTAEFPVLPTKETLSNVAQAKSPVPKPDSSLLVASKFQTTVHASKSATFVDKQSKQTTSNNPARAPIGLRDKPLPAKKPPVAAKSNSLRSMIKPAIKPKPLQSPRANSQVANKATTNNESENKQQAVKNSDLKTKNASLRAAFFNVPLSPNASNSSAVEATKQPETMKDKITTHSTAKNQVQSKESLATTGIKTSQPTDAVNGYLETSTAVVNKDIIPKSNRIDCSPVKIINNQSAERQSSIERNDLNPTAKIDDLKSNLNNHSEKADISNSVESIPSLISSDSAVLSADDMKEEATPAPVVKQLCNGVSRTDRGMEQNGLTADDFRSPTKDAKLDFKSSMQRLRGSYYSTSTTSDYSPGNKSPSHIVAFDRKSNFRFSASSLERRRKTSSNAALREDFKALLLQNLPKSNSGSQMSATEKLKIAKQSPAESNPTVNGVDVPDSRTGAPSQPWISPLGDVRPLGTSRPGRRPNRVAEYRKSYTATSTGYLAKKHPPISSSGRYNTRSRTPTRPMMAITEDSESEISPEKTTEEQLLQRSKSVGDF